MSSRAPEFSPLAVHASDTEASEDEASPVATSKKKRSGKTSRATVANAAGFGFVLGGLLVFGLMSAMNTGSGSKGASIITDSSQMKPQPSWDGTFHSGPAQQEDEETIELAAKSAKENEDLKKPAGGMPIDWVPVAGLNHVVDDEGPEIKDVVKGDLDTCKAACSADQSCNSFIFSDIGGGSCHLKTKVLSSSAPVHRVQGFTSYFESTDRYRPVNRKLAEPSTATAHTYYVYRAQGPKGPYGDYPVDNVNVASLGGAMWYLHDEVVKDCWFGGKRGSRRFGISRLRRFKLTTKATQPLIDKGMNYGILTAFDNGESTGWERGWHYGSGWKYVFEWNRHGYYVGCNNLGNWPHDENVFKRARNYPNAIWYSLPGPCPQMNFRAETRDCKLNYPGGKCDSPTGQGNCTYSVEEAGEIDLDELVGITPKWPSREEFCKQGGYEGDGARQANGHKIDFWNNIWDKNANARRVKAALDMFDKKYPDMPKSEDMQPPPCDFTTKGYW